MNPQSLTRRDLLAHTGRIGAAAVAAPYVIPSGVLAAPGRVGPNDKISIALIGSGGQGNWNLGQLLEQQDVAITAICDVWKERRDRTLTRCKDAKGYNDFREVLQRDDIDAVLIATHPHWHAYISIAAAEAGKDFYCEKPMTLGVGESLAVLRAARKHKRVTQIGTQIHATANYRRVVDVVRSGALGKISTVRTFHVLNQGPEGLGHSPETDPPEGLDWEMWCGPAPLRPFNMLIAKDSYTNPSFMAYSGGWTPGMAPHIVDVPWWALELDYPRSTSSTGGRYIIQDDGDAYDFHQVQWQFPNLTVTWWTSLVNSYGFDNQGGPGLHRRRGMYFHGVNGTMLADYDVLKIIPEGDRMKGFEIEKVEKVIPDSPGHHREWLDCIRSRQQPSCSVEYHHKIDIAINLSLISLKLGRSVQFDPATLTIPNDPEANKLLVPPYRAPWKFPSQYLT